MTGVIVTSQSTRVVLEPNRIVVRLSGRGPQGPPGPPGPSGGGTVVYPAGADISAYRILYLDADTQKALVADKDAPESSSSVIGMNTSAVVEDEDVTITVTGAITNSGWNWSMSGDLSLFLGNGGQITRTPTTTGYSLRVGFVTSPTSIFINLKDFIILT